MLNFKMPHDNSEHDFDVLPEPTRQGIISRAMAHIFGNEVASAVVSKIRTTIAETSEPKRKAETVTTDEVKRYRKEKPEQVKTWTDEFQAEKKTAILEGKLGVRTGGGGAAVDPLTRAMHKIAVDEVTELLSAHGLKMPRGEEVIDLAGQKLGRGDLIARRLNTNGANIEKEAKAQLAAAARKAKAIKEGSAGVAEALGL